MKYPEGAQKIENYAKRLIEKDPEENFLIRENMMHSSVETVGIAPQKSKRVSKISSRTAYPGEKKNSIRKLCKIPSEIEAGSPRSRVLS